MALSGNLRGTCIILALATLAAVGCGGSSSDDDDDSAGKSGSSGTGGGTASGGTGGSANGGTDSTGNGGTTSKGGSGGSANGGTTSKGGSGGKGGGASGGSSGSSGSGGSGGSGGGSEIPITSDCSSFTPCGGDVVGTWKLTSICGDVSGGETLPAGCEGSTETAKLVGDTFVTLGSDGSVTSSGSLGVELDLSIDDACAMAEAMGGNLTAAQLCPLLEATFQGDGSGDTSATCTVSGALCNCHITAANAEVTPTANMYTISGNQIVLSDGSVDDYCVQGNTLTLRDTSSGTLSVSTKQ